jgi:hypothetical protein
MSRSFIMFKREKTDRRCREEDRGKGGEGEEVTPTPRSPFLHSCWSLSYEKASCFPRIHLGVSPHCTKRPVIKIIPAPPRYYTSLKPYFLFHHHFHAQPM